MVMMQAQQRYYSPDEYLELEIVAEERHEYIDGEIVLMPGGFPNHNRLAGNLYAALNFALKRQPYDVFITDQRLWIPERRIYTYPDVMLIAQPLEYAEGRKDTLTNPLMIAEVLSKSTRSYDKDKKFAAYRTIPSFQEYVLIDQYEMQVEYYRKTEGSDWLFSVLAGDRATLSLSAISFEITLADLYDKVNFEVEE